MARKASAFSTALQTARSRVVPAVAVAVASLLIGIWAGLGRIGWQLPGATGGLMLRHGGLMVVGFLATVIAVERAVAVRSRLAIAAPILSAIAGLSLWFGLPTLVSAGLAAASAAAYTANLTLLWRLQPQIAGLALAVGGACLFVAACVWGATARYSAVIPWWMAFLVFTIAGERLELTRFQRIGRGAMAAGAAGFALVIIGPALSLLDARPGTFVLGVGMVASAAWAGFRDPARRAIRGSGLSRFAAAGVLTAFTWLAVSGVFIAVSGLSPTTLAYDAVVHTFFTGFVFAAIIAHEPLIAPAISGRDFAFSRWLYVPLVVLGAGLLLRIGADIAAAQGLRREAGMVQAIALIALVVLTGRGLLTGRRGRTSGPAPTV